MQTKSPGADAYRAFADKVGMSPSETKQYSLSRAIKLVSCGNRLDGLEGEAHRAMAAVRGEPTREMSLYVPHEVMVRDMTTTAAYSSGLVSTGENVTGSFVEMLREQSLVNRLGVVKLPGLLGDASIPSQTGGANAYWITDELTSIGESNPTIGQVKLKPKVVGAYTEVSRLLLQQSNPRADSIIMKSLALDVGAAVDDALINGSGTGGEPAGLLTAGGVAMGTFNGTTLAYAGILDAIGDLSTSAVVNGSAIAFVAPHAVAKALMARQRFSGTDTPLWDGSFEDGRVAGVRAIATRAAPANSLILGDWSRIWIGEWGQGLEIQVNPFTNFPAGITGIRCFYSVDIGVTQGGAFSASTNVS
ncbi:MAG: phage major capsid protein [Planctomycetales bacterium]|nr:phage major capsid protein [Planctomycetales bacterium]